MIIYLKLEQLNKFLKKGGVFNEKSNIIDDFHQLTHVEQKLLLKS